jgi:hypothetical protein
MIISDRHSCDMKEMRRLYRIMIQDDPALWMAEEEKTLAAAAG